MPSHYLNQCWNIVNWTLMNKPKWNLNRNSYIFWMKMCIWKCHVENGGLLSQPQCVKRWLIPSSLWYKMHFSRQLSCWSLRCSWSIACRRCSNYIFILHLTPGFNILCKDNYKQRRETFKFGDLVQVILEILLRLYWKQLDGFPTQQASIGILRTKKHVVKSTYS